MAFKNKKPKFQLHLPTVMDSFTLWFIIVALIVFAPFYTKGLSLVWNLDGVGQYYPAFLYIGEYLRSHLEGFSFLHGIQKFDFRIAMGENIVSSLNYYGFGDPLNLLAVFSNAGNGPYLFSSMIVLRLYLAGLSFKLYSRYMKLDKTLSTVGALGYVFSGYAIWGGTMYTQFLSPLIYLPLLLYGCEKIWKEHKYRYLVLASLYASLCNLYFLYMAVLYLIVYCLVRTYFLEKASVADASSAANDSLRFRSVKNMLAGCIKCALAAVAGFFLSLPVTLQFLRGVLSSARSEVAISEAFSIANWLPSSHKIARYLMGVLPYERYWANIPVLVCIALVLSLFSWKQTDSLSPADSRPRFRFMRFFRHTNNRRKQCALAVWTGTILTILPITYLVFSMFNGNYDRWHFLLIFSDMIIFAVIGDEVILKNTPPQRKNRVRLFMQILCVVNIALGGFIICSPAGFGYADEFIATDAVKMYTDAPVNYSATIQSDESLYRISNDTFTDINGRPENLAMINDYNGLTFWMSVVNGNTQEMVNRLNTVHANTWRGYGLTNSLVYESMAGVKYYLRHDNTDFPTEYELVENVDFYGEPWEIYRNPLALPVIYAFSEEYYEQTLEEAYYNQDVSVLDNAVKAENVAMRTDEFSADITLEEDGCVLLAVPYSEGWKAYVDGEETEVFQTDILYMGIKAEKGTHSIMFKY